jgi:hypothetical protein
MLFVFVGFSFFFPVIIIVSCAGSCSFYYVQRGRDSWVPRCLSMECSEYYMQEKEKNDD